MGPETRTILVVDDEEGIREVISEFLRPLGFQILLASESTEAYQHLQSDEPIDVLITDVSLPDVDGVALSGVARDLRPNIGVVYITGKTEGFLSRSNVLLPNSVILRKPFYFPELLKALNESIGNRHKN
jgi:CheY-like chemotaxis protein